MRDTGPRANSFLDVTLTTSATPPLLHASGQLCSPACLRAAWSPLRTPHPACQWALFMYVPACGWGTSPTPQRPKRARHRAVLPTYRITSSCCRVGTEAPGKEGAQGPTGGKCWSRALTQVAVSSWARLPWLGKPEPPEAEAAAPYSISLPGTDSGPPHMSLSPCPLISWVSEVTTKGLPWFRSHSL